MAITTRDQLISALGSAKLLNFGYISYTTVAGQRTSNWYIQGLFGRSAIPTTAAACTSSTKGALFLPTVTTLKIYLSKVEGVSTIAGTLVVYDRLSHMGGLSGTSTSAQTVNLNISTPSSQNRCLTDGTNVLWYFLWYAATGGTAVTATISYTNESGVSGKTTTVSLAATRGLGYMQPIYPNVNDVSITSIQSVTLSATTGTTGNFGVTATKPLTVLPLPVANIANVYDYSNTGLPQIQSTSCIQTGLIGGGSTTGVLYGTVHFLKG